MTNSAMYKALVAAQKAFAPALKTHTNPAFKSRYADLSACVEAVLDALNANGFFLSQITHESEGGVAVETRLIHESGEHVSSGILRVPAVKQDAQGYGSALTYARRYSLMSVCGIAPEDDDGNAAAKGPKKPTSVAADEWSKLDAETQEWLRSQCIPIKAALAGHDVIAAADMLTELYSQLGTEQKAAAWSLFASDERRALKAEGDRRKVAT